MTVNTLNITSGPYIGNNVATQFSYDFRIEDKTQVIVFETDNFGNETTLTVDTDYTVGGIGNDSGGLITRNAGALPTDYQWYIRSNYQATQDTEFSSQGAFFPEIHESAFDKLTYLIQQLTDGVKRSLRFADSYDVANGTGIIPKPESLKMLRWKNDESGLENIDVSTIDPGAVVIGDYVRQVATINDLLVLETDSAVVSVAGYYTAGDGGGGQFSLQNSAAITDDCLIFDSVMPGKHWKRINYSSVTALMCGITNDGVLRDTELQNATTVLTGQELEFTPGEYNFSVYPTGLDDIHYKGSSKVTFTDKKLPLFMGVFTGNRDVALLGAIIRYYPSGPNGAGWYTLVDQGEEHDPILMGPITASGDHGQEIAINFADFGFDPSLWTPSDFELTPDDTFASEGITVGASTGETSMIITGSFNITSATVAVFDGTNWTYSGASGGASPVTYTFQWINGGTITATLRVVRTSGARKFRPGPYAGVDFNLFAKSKTTGVVGYNPKFVTQGTVSGNTYFEMYFEDPAGVRLQNLNNNVQFIFEDKGAKNPQLRWKDIETPSMGNIGITAKFTRK